MKKLWLRIKNKLFKPKLSNSFIDSRGKSYIEFPDFDPDVLDALINTGQILNIIAEIEEEDKKKPKKKTKE